MAAKNILNTTNKAAIPRETLNTAQKKLVKNTSTTSLTARDIFKFQQEDQLAPHTPRVQTYASAMANTAVSNPSTFDAFNFQQESQRVSQSKYAQPNRSNEGTLLMPESDIRGIRQTAPHNMLASLPDPSYNSLPLFPVRLSTNRLRICLPAPTGIPYSAPILYTVLRFRILLMAGPQQGLVRQMASPKKPLLIRRLSGSLLALPVS